MTHVPVVDRPSSSADVPQRLERPGSGPTRWKLSLLLAVAALALWPACLIVGGKVGFSSWPGAEKAAVWEWVLYYLIVVTVILVGEAQMRVARSMVCAGLVLLAGAALMMPFVGAVIALPLIALAVIISAVACATAPARARRADEVRAAR